MSKKKRNYDSYTGDNVQVLDDIDGIRKRHGMYAGSIESVSHHLFDEIMDNSVDEFLNGFADTIWVNFNKKDNLVTITDNGRGMPIDIHEESGKPTMEVLVSSTHAGGKFDNETFKVSSGLNGVGATVVNALSSTFDLTSFRGSHEYNMSFEEGRKVKDFTKKKKRKELSKEESGTIVSFIPDKTILGKYAKLDEKLIKDNLEIRSYINSGLKIIFNDSTVYHHPNGIKELIEDRTDERFTDIFYFKEEEPSLGNLYEIAFTYVSESDETIYSFANGIETSKGTHESGFRKGLTDSMKSFIRDNNLLPGRGMKMKDITGEDIRSGVVAVVNIRYADADYSAQTKDELTNPELFGKISSITKSNLDRVFSSNLDSFKKVGNRIVQFTRGRMRAASYKDAVVKVDNKAMGLVDNGKFVDCNGEDVSKRELLIIEGDSASGSIRQSRDPDWQAVFPLRGKILNTSGMSLSRIVKNQELNNLLIALFGSNDLNKIDQKKDLRFSKIILLSDADFDGNHINSLLVNFFFEFLPDLFSDGNIYVGLPPKYSYQDNKGNFHYIKNDLELQEFELNYVAEDIEIINKENIDIDKFMEIKNMYQREFNNIIHQYSVSENLLSMFMIPDEFEYLDEIIANVGLDYDHESDHVTGIYEEEWHDFYVDDLLNALNKVNSLHDFKERIQFIYKNEEYKMYPIDFIKYINKTYNFKYNYFKGLGEASPQELFETTIGPGRDLLQLEVSDIDKTEELLIDMFNVNKTGARRELMRVYLN